MHTSPPVHKVIRPIPTRIITITNYIESRCNMSVLSTLNRKYFKDLGYKRLFRFFSCLNPIALKGYYNAIYDKLETLKIKFNGPHNEWFYNRKNANYLFSEESKTELVNGLISIEYFITFRNSNYSLPQILAIRSPVKFKCVNFMRSMTIEDLCKQIDMLPPPSKNMKNK
jgi:hypothetical protein